MLQAGRRDGIEHVHPCSHFFELIHLLGFHLSRNKFLDGNHLQMTIGTMSCVVLGGVGMMNGRPALCLFYVLPFIAWVGTEFMYWSAVQLAGYDCLRHSTHMKDQQVILAQRLASLFT